MLIGLATVFMKASQSMEEAKGNSGWNFGAWSFSKANESP